MRKLSIVLLFDCSLIQLKLCELILQQVLGVVSLIQLHLGGKQLLLQLLDSLLCFCCALALFLLLDLRSPFRSVYVELVRAVRRRVGTNPLLRLARTPVQLRRSLVS